VNQDLQNLLSMSNNKLSFSKTQCQLILLLVCKLNLEVSKS